jgi:hypothetical protein
MAERSSGAPSRKMNQFRNGGFALEYTNVAFSSAVTEIANIGATTSSSIATISDTTNTAITSIAATVSQSNATINNTLTSISSSVTYTLDQQNIDIASLENAVSSAVRSSKVFVSKEIPYGAIDGSNTTYTLEHTPTPGSEHLYLNGLLVEEGADTDYFISGSTITFSEPLLAGMQLQCTYHYNSEQPTLVFVDKEIPYGTIDGRNKTFTLADNPVLGSEHLYLNGLLQQSGGNDYVIDNNVIIFIEAPAEGMVLRCTYYYNI